jgi:hypothetical protein
LVKCLLNKLLVPAGNVGKPFMSSGFFR